MLRRRRSGAPIRRGQFFPFVPTVAVQAPTRVPDPISQAGRRSRTATVRRGRIAQAPAQSARQPDALRQSPRPRQSLARRGQLFAVPPAAVVAPQAPAWVPDQIQQAGHRPRLGFTRRGRLLATPTPQAPPPASVSQSRRGRGALARRGRFYPVPQAVQTPVVPIGRRRPAPALARRGDYFAIPLTPDVTPPAGPGPVVPVVGRALPRRLVPIRRGRIFQIPLAGLAPVVVATVPARIGYRVRPSLPTRRGRLLAVIGAPVVPPTRPSRRRSAPALARRGRLWPLPLINLPPATPGPLAPAAIRQRRRWPNGLPRRSGWWDAPVSDVCDCTTHRPNSGTTTRPVGGATSRPAGGTTVRPGSGTTVRPYSGITERPCSCGGD